MASEIVCTNTMKLHFKQVKLISEFDSSKNKKAYAITSTRQQGNAYNPFQVVGFG